MKVKDLPPQAELKAKLNYNPETGYFTWRPCEEWRPNDVTRLAYKIAGYKNKGYWKIKINDVMYQAHRLVWVYVHGALNTDMVLDHINGDKADNRLSNLRLASPSENSCNAKLRTGKSLPKGVTRTRNDRYLSRITMNYKTITLGTYKTISAAADAYCNAAKSMKGEYARFA